MENEIMNIYLHLGTFDAAACEHLANFQNYNFILIKIQNSLIYFLILLIQCSAYKQAIYNEWSPESFTLTTFGLTAW